MSLTETSARNGSVAARTDWYSVPVSMGSVRRRTSLAGLVLNIGQDVKSGPKINKYADFTLFLHV
jgi:hypothetical protein